MTYLAQALSWLAFWLIVGALLRPLMHGKDHRGG